MSEAQASANMQPENAGEQAPAVEGGEGDSQLNVINRVAALPMVSSTLTQVSSAYNWTKDKNSLVKYTLEMAETTVAKAASTAQPVVTKLEGPISAANNFANQQLDKLEEKVPIITETPGQVLSDLQNGTMQMIDNTKKASSDRINNLLLTRLGKVVTTGMDTALLLSEFAVDYYLPQEAVTAGANGSADGDLPVQQEALAAAGVGEDENEALPEKPLEATVQKATRITNKVRRRVVNKAMRNVRYAQKRSKETLDKLHYTVDLMEYARTNIDSASQAVQSRIETTQESLWKTWDDWTLEEGEAVDKEADHTEKAEVEATNGEQKTLAIARSLAGRLRVLSGNIAMSVRLLPQSMRSRVEEGRDLADALYNSLEEVQTIRELPTNVLTTAKQQLNKLSDITMSVADFLVSSTPLQWLVPSQVRQYLDSSISSSSSSSSSSSNANKHPAEVTLIEEDSLFISSSTTTSSPSSEYDYQYENGIPSQ